MQGVRQPEHRQEWNQTLAHYFFPVLSAEVARSLVYVCMYVFVNVFYGAYNYSGLVRQVSGFSNVVSVRRVHVVLWTAGFKGRGTVSQDT